MHRRSLRGRAGLSQGDLHALPAGRAEVSRCIDADTCTYFISKGTCKACEKFCPTEAIDFDQQDEIVTVQVGNIILATGFDLFDARRIPQYGYGRLANVFTSLEFERLCNAAGPTGGKIVLRDGKTAPKAVGIIHCVGSRDRNYNNYCSAICCMQSLKFAHLVKERTGAEVYNFYIDMRTPAKDYDEFYQRVLDEGMHFVRGKVAEVTDAARCPDEEGKLIVQVEDTLVGKQRRIPVDMVILSAGLEPRPTPRKSAKTFGISCCADGWFIEKHPKLDPVATMTDGVFIAGCVARGRRTSRPASSRAPRPRRACWAASSRARWRWSRCAPASIEEQCSGCRICNTLCPFNAIRFIEDRRSPRSTRRCARAAAPAWPPARPAPSAAPASATSRSWPRSRACCCSILEHVTRSGAHRHEEACHDRRQFEPVIVGFTCNWCSLPRRRPGRHGAHQVSAQRAPDPPDVLRAARSDLRAQGPRRAAPTAC